MHPASDALVEFVLEEPTQRDRFTSGDTSWEVGQNLVDLLLLKS